MEKRKGLNLTEQRSLARGLAKSHLRRRGVSFDAFEGRPVPVEDALRVLDELRESKPDLFALQWYANASERQLALFRREWKEQALRPAFVMPHPDSLNKLGFYN